MSRLDLSKASAAEVKAEIERLEEALDRGMVWPKEHSLYLHGSKETNYGDAYELGLDGEAVHNYAYVGYEIEIKTEVHQNGDCFATHFAGVELPKKVKI